MYIFFELTGMPGADSPRRRLTIHKSQQRSSLSLNVFPVQIPGYWIHKDRELKAGESLSRLLLRVPSPLSRGEGGSPIPHGTGGICVPR